MDLFTDGQRCLFCSGAHGPGQPCDGKQGAQEADAPPPAAAAWIPTRSTAEAMELLRRTRARLIVEARQIARDLISQRGETHARAVLEEMAKRGMSADLAAVNAYWLGAVFRSREFKWTGRFYEPPESEVKRDEDHNIHSWRPVRVWTLAAVAVPA